MIIKPLNNISDKNNPFTLSPVKKIRYLIKHKARTTRRRISSNKAFQPLIYDGRLASNRPQGRAILYLAWGEITLANKNALINLTASGLDIFIIVNRKSARDYKAYIPYARKVMDRPNWGNDFGGWKDGVQHFDLSSYNFIYFTNDSIIGPWAPISNHLNAFETSEAEVFGITDSIKINHYIQSYFFGVSSTVYNASDFQKFWSDFLFINKQGYLIGNGELSLSKPLHKYYWYIVAPRSELAKKYELNKDRIMNIVGDNKIAAFKNGHIKGGIDVYHRKVVDDYNFPIVKVDKFLIDEYYINKFGHLIEKIE